jgi:hypothetical protein
MVIETWRPGLAVEGDYFLVPGDYRTARTIIGRARDSIVTRDGVAPFGYLDVPKAGAAVRGITQVAGWAIDNDSVRGVTVYVDGALAGQANYGLPRPDVRTPYRGSPVNVGYRYLLDTSKYSNGAHDITVRVTDWSGTVAVFPAVLVTITN